MNVNLKLLQAFIEVAEHGSFRRAAEEIGRTQSAVSMQIRQLEEQLGLRLFQRTTRQVRLTPEGARLLTHVRSAMAELMAGLRLAEGLAAHRGRVAVACAPSLAGSRLPRVMAAFQDAFPGAQVEVRELPLAGILDCVRAQDVDFGVGPPPPASAGLLFRPLLEDPICALVPPGLLPARPRASLRLLARHPLVMMAGLRELVEEEARAQGLALSIRYQAQQILAVAGLVEARLGIGIVPRLAAEGLEGDRLQVLPLVTPRLTRQVGILTRRNSTLSPLATELERRFAEVMGSRPAARSGRQPTPWSGPVDTV
ncbi:LysR family transcriptional regulator (plasmid) [Roseomonas marmotae]|uniref:LysR family transcriptional regulator n=1 Tax=Roseomonas marmotae TaxID=2768161 RepID=UPI001AD6CB0E|nr:LysR family transcriptional regulator [Roseomonas marmotae]QTI81800.1 LysR family transcriptional regulator [Roseomonas marmotae]